MSKTNKVSLTKALSTRVLYHVMKVLAESDGFVPKAEILDRLFIDLDLSDWELANAGKSENPRWKNALWYTSDAVKAGFIVKAHGKWRITQG